MKMFKKSMIVTAAVFGAPLPFLHSALAQGWIGPPVLVPLPNRSIAIWADEHEREVDAEHQRIISELNGRDSGNAAAHRQPTTNPALLRFTPNLATRQRNLAGFVSKTRAQSPENAAQMEQLFASTDVFAAFAQGLAPQGLRIDNVADCYAAYWITAWEAAHGITGSTTSRAQAQAVKAQVSRALLSTPDFTKSRPAQKQELAEALLIQTALISAAAEAAANDPAQTDAVGTAVRQGAKAMGLDLDAMTLGEAGFVSVG